MDDFEKIVEEGRRSAEEAGKVAEGAAPRAKKPAAKIAPAMGEAAAREAETFWEETRTRGKRVGERVNQEWDRLSGSARDYTREHSMEVAVGSLGAGIVLGLLIGYLVGRD
jgi:ElaB/YqjD/DUF883 family membrane-anchored ribosome-binding protein